MTPRFRPTAWPGSEVPLPGVPVWDVRVHEEHWIELVGEPHEVTLPPDFYLREMSAQRPRTVDEIVEFVGQWGRCADLDSRDRPLGEIWMRQTAEMVAHCDGRLRRNESLTTGRLRIAEQAGVQGGAFEKKRRVVHTAELEDRFEHSDWLARRFLQFRAGEQATPEVRTLFAEQLNAALSAFQASIDVGRGRSPVLADLTAYSVSALQLLNDLAAETPLRNCGNERCPVGAFTRQRGRSQYGQHRTAGIKYCSSSCARAQGERERRRRNAKGAQ